MPEQLLFLLGKVVVFYFYLLLLPEQLLIFSNELPYWTEHLLTFVNELLVVEKQLLVLTKQVVNLGILFSPDSVKNSLKYTNGQYFVCKPPRILSYKGVKTSQKVFGGTPKVGSYLHLLPVFVLHLCTVRTTGVIHKF